MNRCELRGTATQDGKVVYLPSGDPVVEFTLAVDRTRWDSQQNTKVVETDFIRCKAYSQVAQELIDNHDLVAKGDDLYVLGSISQDTYEKRDGTTERKTGVIAWQVNLLRRRAQKAAQPTEDPWAGQK